MNENLKSLIVETKASRPDLTKEIDDLIAIASAAGDHPFIDKSIEKFMKKMAASTSPDDRAELEKVNDSLKKLIERISRTGINYGELSPLEYERGQQSKRTGQFIQAIITVIGGLIIACIFFYR